jgi:pyridoxine 4-dehydrogenase
MTKSKEPSAADAGTMVLGDMEVHRLGFGAMRITGKGVWGEPDDPKEAKRVLRRAIDLGVDMIDTADSYGPEVSERLIAEALHPYPEGLIIGTKGGYARPGPGDWEPDGRPEHLRRACEGSLKRLRLDRIDLYQLHTSDDDVPYAESVGVLADLQAEGKIRWIGVSNVSRDQLETARGLVEVVSVQNRFNLKDRKHEKVLDRCAELGIAFLPWFPLGAGDLVGGTGALAEIAETHGATAAQIALAWLLARSPVMLPIPGTSSVEHLEQNVAAAGIELADEEVRRLGAR